MASVLSLPLLLGAFIALTSLVSALTKSKPRSLAQPKAGFPTKLEHPLIGVFALSPYSNEQYERTIEWCGTPTRLKLSVDTLGSIERVLRATASISHESSTVNSQIVAFVIKELLPSINSERQASKTPILGPTEFTQTISLKSITVYPDGTYDFMYSDGGLLGGHWIEVHGEIARGPIDLSTPG